MMAAPDTTLDGLTEVATISRRFEQDGKDVVDFDFDAATDYEIESRALVEDGRVVEAVARFGMIDEHEEIGVGGPILAQAWDGIVSEVDPDGEYTADMSDFSKNVPHFRVSDMDTDEFERVMIALFERVESVLRGDAQTVDQKIDEYL